MRSRYLNVIQTDGQTDRRTDGQTTFLLSHDRALRIASRGIR